MRKLILMGFVTLMVSNGSLFAADSSKKVITVDKIEYPIKASCTSERRYPDAEGSSTIKVEIESLKPVWIFTKMELTKAIDDTGKDLIKEKVRKIKSSLDVFREKKDADFTFYLKQGDRAAKVIKEIEGTIYLQNSGSGRKIAVPDFQTEAGQFIVNDELKKQGIKIAYIDSKTFDEKGSKLVFDAIMPDSVKTPNEEQRKASLASLKMACSQAGIMTLVVIDPEKKVLEIEVLDPKTKKAVKSMSAMKNLLMFSVISKHGSDEKSKFSGLLIYLKDKQLIQKAPFKFQNIKLP